MPAKKEDNPKLEEATVKVREGVIDMLKAGCSYFDIEEAVSDAIVIANNEYVYVDIHK